MREDVELLRTHREHLERFRSSMNLVGPGSLEQHYVDCRMALKGLEAKGRWADLGTGAGFPGIVFAALFPEVQVDLVDSRAKRSWFLEQVLLHVERPNLHVVRGRHEDLTPGYDGVLSRALHAPEAMVEVARRLLVPGGTMVLFLQADADVPEAPDIEVFHVKHYDLDGKQRKSAFLKIG